MSRLFLTNIDLNTNELQNAVIQNLSSAPLSGNKEGRIYYDVTSKQLYLYTDGQWKPLASGGAAASSLELTGDVTGYATVDSATGKITLETTIVNDSIVLGTDTEGDYVAGINGTTNEIDVVNSGGEGSTPTISLPNTIYKPTTFSLGYQEGFDITFNGDTGDTYLNQTTGDGTVHVLGTFRVDYGTTNNPEYAAFTVNPGGAITDVRNILNVNSDGGDTALTVNGNSGEISLYNPNYYGNQTLKIWSDLSDGNITATSGALNITSNNSDITLNPDGQTRVNSNLTVTGNIYGQNGLYLGGGDSSTNGFINLQDSNGQNLFTVNVDGGEAALDLRGYIYLRDVSTGITYGNIGYDGSDSLIINASNNDLVLKSRTDKKNFVLSILVKYLCAFKTLSSLSIKLLISSILSLIDFIWN